MSTMARVIDPLLLRIRSMRRGDSTQRVFYRVRDGDKSIWSAFFSGI